jgi:hypothetical protein
MAGMIRVILVLGRVFVLFAFFVVKFGSGLF